MALWWSSSPFTCFKRKAVVTCAGLVSHETEGEGEMIEGEER